MIYSISGVLQGRWGITWYLIFGVPGAQRMIWGAGSVTHRMRYVGWDAQTLMISFAALNQEQMNCVAEHLARTPKSAV